MFKKSLIVAVIYLLGTVAVAKSACTPEEVQAKAQQFMELAIQLSQKEPQCYQEIVQAMQSQLPEFQKTNDLDGLCKFYDEWISKIR